MRETVTLIGMVPTSVPSGDYDRRLVSLTRERGQIAAFSHGARKLGNTLMATSRPFSFGIFSMYEGGPTYSLRSAWITNCFDGLPMDIECTYYGSYFLEMAGYFSQENMDGAEMLELLYQSLRAPLKPAIPDRLVRRIFELKTVVISGEHTETLPSPASESCGYAWEYVVCSPVEILYEFVLKEDVMRESGGAVDKNRRYYAHHEFESLEILDMLTT